MRISETRLSAISEKMKMIADDAEAGAKNFEGQPFNGRTVAEYFGAMGAQVQAISLSLQEIVDTELQDRQDQRKEIL